jgi:hypothetical protein
LVVLDGRAIPVHLFRVLLLSGLILRAAGLPLRGTDDFNVWKLWTHAGSTSVTTMYGVGGTPPQHAVVKWGNRSATVDYPPATLYALAAIGYLYRAYDPFYADGPALNATVKLSILLSDIGLCVALWALMRPSSVAAGQRAVLFYWLNPAAILNGAILGYLDPWLGALTMAAVLAVDRQQFVLCGATLALAALTKLQIALVLPMFVLLFAQRVDRKRWWNSALAAVAAGLVTAVVLMAPFARIGAFWNMVQGAGRAFHHDMLSAENANVWWIATWLLRAGYGVHDLGWWTAFTMPVRILGISRAMELGYPNARLIGTAVGGAVMLWAFWLARRGSLRIVLASGALAMHAYTLLSVQVHENHFYLALPLMAAAGATLPRLRGPYALGSAVCLFNMLLFQGLGKDVGIPRRDLAIVDATVLLAFVNIGAFVWHARRFTQEAAREQGDGGGADAVQR